MKKIIALLLTLTMVASLGAVLTSCASDTAEGIGESTTRIEEKSNTQAGSSLSYVTIDINPSFELIAEDGNVVNCTALNEDADMVMDALPESIEGLDIEAAVGAIVSESADEGYLTEENPEVAIEVTDMNGDTEAADRIYAKAEKAVKAEAEKPERGFIKNVRGDKNGASNALAQLLTDEAYKDNEKVQNLTPGQYRLICEVMDACDLTLEQALELSHSELISMLKDVRKAEKELSAYERKEVRKAEKAAKKNAEAETGDVAEEESEIESTVKEAKEKAEREWNEIKAEKKQEIADKKQEIADKKAAKTTASEETTEEITEIETQISTEAVTE